MSIKQIRPKNITSEYEIKPCFNKLLFKIMLYKINMKNAVNMNLVKV